VTAHVLVHGTLFRAAETRTASSDPRYVKATLRAAAGDNSAADFWHPISFSEAAGAELSRLSDDERIAVQGALKLELYQPEGKQAKIQRTVFLDHALVLRALAKPKKPKAAPAAQTSPLERVSVVPPSGASPLRFDDDISF
jgi:hypothetical protein